MSNEDMGMLVDFKKVVAHISPACPVTRKYQQSHRHARIYDLTNDDLTAEPAKREGTPDAEVFASREEASTNEEATTAGNFSEDDSSDDDDCSHQNSADSSDDKDCRDQDSTGQTSDDYDCRKSFIMKRVGQYVKRAAEAALLEREQEQDAKNMTVVNRINFSVTASDSSAMSATAEIYSISKKHCPSP